MGSTYTVTGKRKTGSGHRLAVRLSSSDPRKADAFGSTPHFRDRCFSVAKGGWLGPYLSLSLRVRRQSEAGLLPGSFRWARGTPQAIPARGRICAP